MQAFKRDITGRHEISGPDTTTFDGAFERLGRGRGRRIQTLHLPLIAMRVPGWIVPYVRELAHMMTLFDLVGYAADPSILRDTFGVRALTIEEWARRTG